MTTTVFPVQRRLSPEEASTLVGTPVPEPKGEIVASPRAPGDVVQLVDVELQEIVGLVTKLDRKTAGDLREAVTGFRMVNGVLRRGMPLKGQNRTFGWAPKRAIGRRESCRTATSGQDHPGEAAVLTHLGGILSEEFRHLLPDRAAADEAVLREAILPDWFMEDRALWTSGVVNKSATLPYHRDGANFHTWSAMPTLRYRMDGGRLHLPEYDIAFPCRDGEVTWFCGRDLVHGVTPMRMAHEDAYRFSVVYYALRGMKDCRTYAEETEAVARRRTLREQAMAEAARTKLGLS